MNKYIGKAAMVLMVGAGCLWADQAPQDPLAQSAQTFTVPSIAGQDASKSATLDHSSSLKSSSKKVKKSKGLSKSSRTKKGKKKNSKTSKKSKSVKSKKKLQFVLQA